MVDYAGRIVILNGAPRSGKTTLSRAIQKSFPSPWVNLGVDLLAASLPPGFGPGMGLRPGGERPDLEPLVQKLFASLYDSVASFSRQGLNVIVDVGHHDSYSRPLDTLGGAALRLQGLPVLFVGVHCHLDEIMRRRALSEGEKYLQREDDGTVPEPVIRWQVEVHRGHHYDVEVDTSVMGIQECVERIAAALDNPPNPTAFERLVLEK